MFKTVVCIVCLLVGTCQTTLSQGSPPSEPKSTATAVKYSAYRTAIPIVIGGAALLLAAHSDGGNSGDEGEDSDDNETAVIIGINIGALGAVTGPGFGHAYAGRWGHLAKGSLFRAVGAILIIRGIIGSDPSGMGGWGDSGDEDNGDEGTDAGLIGIGGAIYLWSTIHDFRTLDEAVDRYNQKHAGVTVNVGPTYFASENALGVVVNLGF